MIIRTVLNPIKSSESVLVRLRLARTLFLSIPIIDFYKSKIPTKEFAILHGIHLICQT